MAAGDAARAQALLEKGASLYEEGQLYEALSCWKQVLEIDPKNEIAAEYLRFIEDNFQIGVDAFLSHHAREPTPVTGPLPRVRADVPRPPPIPEPAPASSGEDIEELDWSEV